MPRTHPAYPPEFRHQMVELVRSRRSPTELARDFEYCADELAPISTGPPGTALEA